MAFGVSFTWKIGLWFTTSWTGQLRFLFLCWHTKKSNLWIRISWWINRTKAHFDPQSVAALNLHARPGVNLFTRKISMLVVSIISDSSKNVHVFLYASLFLIIPNNDVRCASGCVNVCICMHTSMYNYPWSLPGLHINRSVIKVFFLTEEKKKRTKNPNKKTTRTQKIT